MKDIVPHLREVRHEKSSFSIIVISSIMAGFVLLAFLILTPVPAAIPENCETITGTVARVYSPCCKDVVIELQDDGHRYHINRALQRGIELRAFDTQLLNNPVTLHYIRTHWSPLDPFGELRPVAQVASGGEILYSTFPKVSPE